jgi:hypothetical protein
MELRPSTLENIKKSIQEICDKASNCECKLSGICPYFADETDDVGQAHWMIVEMFVAGEHYSDLYI